MKLDDVKKLHQKKYRSELCHFLVEGEHLVLELQKAAQSNNALEKSELFVTEQYQHFDTPFKKTVVTEKQMGQISDTKTPQGIIAVAPCLPIERTQENSRAIYLNEIQDPGNLGTILRTLAWFGGFRCLLSPDSVDPYNPKVVRSSMGAIFHVPIEIEVPITQLNSRFKRIGCLDMQGAPLTSPEFKKINCFIFGNEARGVPRDQLNALAAEAFTIKGCGAIESLNLATAVNMCAYELMRI